jgi:hypothetical protein
LAQQAFVQPSGHDAVLQQDFSPQQDFLESQLVAQSAEDPPVAHELRAMDDIAASDNKDKFLITFFIRFLFFIWVYS